MQKRIPNTLLVIAILLIGLGGLFAVKLTPPKPVELQSGFLFPNAFGLAPFELVDQHKQAFTNANLTDQWSLFFIGFTYCPDICPTTLNKLAAV